MTARQAQVALAAYALIGVVTFGHAAAENARWLEQRCAKFEQRQSNPGDCYFHPTGPALIAAVAWPLYWSWEVFDAR